MKYTFKSEFLKNFQCACENGGSYMMITDLTEARSLQKISQIIGEAFIWEFAEMRNIYPLENVTWREVRDNPKLVLSTKCIKL